MKGKFLTCVVLKWDLFVDQALLQHPIMHSSPNEFFRLFIWNRTLPLRLLLPKIDWLYKAVSIHVHLPDLWQIQLVLAIQVLVAVLFTVGYKTRMMTVISWYLYLSLTLRNTWLNFILDRYFHYLLFYAMFLPCGDCWSVDASAQKTKGNEPQRRELVFSPGTVRMCSQNDRFSFRCLLIKSTSSFLTLMVLRLL